jgi:hypothetical protein
MAQILDRTRTARWAEELGDMLSQGAKDDKRDFTVYADDPKGFFYDVLHDHLLYDLQLDIIESVRTQPLTTVRGAHSMGKDHVAAGLGLWFAYCKPGRTKVMITGPTQHQVEEILFEDELKRAHESAKLPGQLYSKALRIPGKPSRLIFGRVSTEIAKLTGHHAPYVMCIVTEAQDKDVSDLAFDAALANATGPNDRILVVGNPTEPTGSFWATHQVNSAWNKIIMPATKHPNVIHGKMIIPGGPSRESLERQRKEWGEDSQDWRTRVLAEFPASASDALLREEWIKRAIDRYQATKEQPIIGTAPIGNEASQRAAYSIGIDVARFGGDFNVIAVLQNGRLIHLEFWASTDTVETERKIVRFLTKIGYQNGKDRVAVDEGAAGGGASVLDHLQDQGVECEGFNGSRRAEDDPDHYANLRAWAYWMLRRAFEDDLITIPSDPMLLEELRAVTYTFNNKDGVQIAKKSIIKTTLHRSPDRADALMMAWSLTGGGISTGGALGNFGF